MSKYDDFDARITRLLDQQVPVMCRDAIVAADNIEAAVKRIVRDAYRAGRREAAA